MTEDAFVIDLADDDSENLEDLEDARNDLRNELLEVPGVEVNLLTRAGEPGTRADVETITGSLGVAILTAKLAHDTLVPTIARIIKNYIDRRGRVVRIKTSDGTSVIMRNLSREEIEEVLDSIVAPSEDEEPAGR